MKIKIEFDNESPNFDQYELNRYLYANKMAICLHEITNKIRGWYKYDERIAIPTEEISEQLWNIINEHVNMEEIGY